VNPKAQITDPGLPPLPSIVGSGRKLDIEHTAPKTAGALGVIGWKLDQRSRH
jgi:hypothetical protein